jgi:hypothetical protein
MPQPHPHEETRMAHTITTQSGRTKTLPANIDPARVAGLDEDGRIVVDNFNARTAEPIVIAGYTQQPHMFGLTLCCNASDKGTEDGIVCRGCWSPDEIGNYLFRAPDGSFPGLDPVV